MRPLGERGEKRKIEKGSHDDEPPIRTYDTLSSRGVRDRRTGHADGDVRRVLGGKIEGFLEATLEQEREA